MWNLSGFSLILNKEVRTGTAVCRATRTSDTDYQFGEKLCPYCNRNGASSDDFWKKKRDQKFYSACKNGWSWLGYLRSWQALWSINTGIRLRRACDHCKVRSEQLEGEELLKELIAIKRGRAGPPPSKQREIHLNEKGGINRSMLKVVERDPDSQGNTRKNNPKKWKPDKSRRDPSKLQDPRQKVRNT